MSQDMILGFFQTMVQNASQNILVDVFIHVDLHPSMLTLNIFPMQHSIDFSQMETSG